MNSSIDLIDRWVVIQCNLFIFSSMNFSMFHIHFIILLLFFEGCGTYFEASDGPIFGIHDTVSRYRIQQL